MKSFSARMRKELHRLQSRSVMNSEFTCKLSPWLRQCITWCDEQNIALGRSLGHDKYIVSRASIESIDRWLKLNDQGSLCDDYSKQDRTQTAKSAFDDKLSGIKPKDHLLLVALTNSELIQPLANAFHQHHLPAQINFEISVFDIDLAPYQQLIIIENRDSFNDWSTFAAQVQVKYFLLQHALVIYRGNERGESKACKRLIARWSNEKTTHSIIGFGDYDWAGLHIAISSGYGQLLLPAQSDIIKLRHELVSDDSEPYRQRDLMAKCPQQWQTLLSLLNDSQQGILQQRMVGISLHLH
ncbi:MAG: hypothetical protein HRU25_00405 [Psychrobium sp.]|nr:hypothetical protein [Psychrobium sp.]